MEQSVLRQSGEAERNRGTFSGRSERAAAVARQHRGGGRWTMQIYLSLCARAGGSLANAPRDDSTGRHFGGSPPELKPMPEVRLSEPNHHLHRYPAPASRIDFVTNRPANSPDRALKTVLTNVGSDFSVPLEVPGVPFSGESPVADPCDAGLPGLAGEQHYSPRVIAQRWGLSETKVRRMFEGEPGVLRIGEPSRRVGRKLRRGYYTMRIPESVAVRVHRRLTAARTIQ
jgi:hypothetical protein